MDAQLLVFTGVVAVLVVTPGADMALVTKNALEGGRRAALMTTLGINVSTVAWAVASAAGLAALMERSAAAFAVLKFAGAAYLITLGLRTIWQAGRGALPGAAGGLGTDDSRRPRGPLPAFRQGLLTNLLNPKMGVFYTALLPQFVSSGDAVLAQSLLLATIHNALAFAWFSGYAAVLAKAGDLLSKPKVRRAMDRITGGALMALGVRVAFEAR